MGVTRREAFLRYLAILEAIPWEPDAMSTGDVWTAFELAGGIISRRQLGRELEWMSTVPQLGVRRIDSKPHKWYRVPVA